jgi:uncharacterized membrane protein YjjB (DUF3815 family)
VGVRSRGVCLRLLVFRLGTQAPEQPYSIVMLSYSFITTLGLALAVSAKVHHLYVGTFTGTSSLYAHSFTLGMEHLLIS